jgi:hypothetical protein
MHSVPGRYLCASAPLWCVLAATSAAADVVVPGLAHFRGGGGEEECSAGSPKCRAGPMLVPKGCAPYMTQDALDTVCL